MSFTQIKTLVSYFLTRTLQKSLLLEKTIIVDLDKSRARNWSIKIQCLGKNTISWVSECYLTWHSLVVKSTQGSLLQHLFIYLTGPNKTEHSLTDGEEQHGSLKLLKKYSFYIFYDKAQVKSKSFFKTKTADRKMRALKQGCQKSPKWSGIQMTFKYRIEFSPIFRPPFEYQTSEKFVIQMFLLFRYSC